MKKIIALLLLIVATIGCDRVTKRMAETSLAGLPRTSLMADTVRLEYAENTGGFLSLGAELPASVRTPLFTIGTGLGLLAMIVAALRLQWRGLQLAALCLFAAGGASNWADRLVRGSVVDFLNVGFGPVRTGIFNVADVAVMAGACLLLFSQVRADRTPTGSEDAAP